MSNRALMWVVVVLLVVNLLPAVHVFLPFRNDPDMKIGERYLIHSEYREGNRFRIMYFEHHGIRCYLSQHTLPGWREIAISDAMSCVRKIDEDA